MQCFAWLFLHSKMIERKCLSCGTWNNDEDYCKNCNNPIKPSLIRDIAYQSQIDAEKNKPKSKFDLFVLATKNHHYLLVRIIYKIVYSISMVFAAIGAFFAWMLAMANG